MSVGAAVMLVHCQNTEHDPKAAASNEHPGEIEIKFLFI